MGNLERVRAIEEAIGAALRTHEHGRANRDAVRQIWRLTGGAINASGDHTYIREKARMLIGTLPALYSDHKHREDLA